MKIILASNSPRRKEMLSNLNINYEVLVDNTIEETTTKNTPCEVVIDLSLKKALGSLKLIKEPEESIIIAADTVVAIKSEILGKPQNKDDAYRMISMLSGNTHNVYTGFTLINSKTNKIISDYVKTDVTFYSLTKKEIENYISTKEPYDKAGAYGIQGYGSCLVEEIKGDYFNVVGLPVGKLIRIMKQEFNLEGAI